MSRKIVVTSALFYANAPIHMGHLVESIQTDIWVRFQKATGNQCLYFCADDTHGTPVMISAKREGISPEQLIDRVHGEHLRDLKKFHIEFDNYYTTHSPENKQFSAKSNRPIVQAVICSCRTDLSEAPVPNANRKISMVIRAIPAVRHISRRNL
jgi:methionyl-tRNA synthetase